MSIHGIKELKGISMDGDGTIVIGPSTTFSHITNHPIIQEHIPILADAVDMIGGVCWKYRNGRRKCLQWSTSADSASSLCCLDALERV